MRKLLLITVLMFTGVACSSGDSTFVETREGSPNLGQGPGGKANLPDPYEVYLKHNPDPSLILSKEDAQTRAFLGCGTTWAPGTIDAVLADAYKGVCR